MTRIYLIRHGESLGNAARMYLGHTDLDLSELGYRQAEATAEELSDVEFEAVYSSDLQRAMNTAEPHAKRRGLKVIPCPEIRELYVGEWEGKHIDELVLDERFTVGWRNNFGTFTLPAGEKVSDGADRVYNALEKIAKKHEGKNVIAALHAAVIRAFWCKMLGLAPEEWAKSVYFPTNASYSVIEYENGRFSPVCYSEDKHLAEKSCLP